MPASHPTRRDFIADTTKVALGAMILPRHLLGGRGYQAPSATLNIAVVGAGGMGMSNMSRLFSENIVAICDVDFPYVERSLENRLRPRTGPQVDAAREAERMAESRKLQEIYTKTTKYADFREMLEKQKDIDAVVIATPDHTHAVIASAAMKLGKHVYVQKPLTYSVHEARALARLAQETKVVTEMGNQGHSGEGTRRIKEIIASGILGPVREVHVWTDRPHRFWPQGIPRPGQDVAQQAAPPQQPPTLIAGQTSPTPTTPPPPPRWSVRTVERAILKEMAANPQTPPEGLNWDLFLGPAKEIAYHPAYHPFSWRGWVDFGVSAIGDMGAHLIDQPYWALDLTYPTTIETASTGWGGPPNDPASYPAAMTAKYVFPARRAVGRTPARPAVTMYWYDGGLMPPRPPFLPDDVTLPRVDGGGVFVGTRGILVYEVYGNNPTIYPKDLAARAERIPKTVPRIEVSHEENWVKACKGEASASSPFDYAAPLTEVMLLGLVALRAGQGQKIVYDAENMKVTNNAAVNAYLTREYRAGWAL
jgi:predicted dehydrogenase